MRKGAGPVKKPKVCYFQSEQKDFSNHIMFKGGTYEEVDFSCFYAAEANKRCTYKVFSAQERADTCCCTSEHVVVAPRHM